MVNYALFMRGGKTHITGLCEIYMCPFFMANPAFIIKQRDIALIAPEYTQTKFSIKASFRVIYHYMRRNHFLKVTQTIRCL